MLQKARELSAKLFDTGQIPPQTPKQEPVPKPTEKEMPNKPKIPPKPVMSVEAAAYPKLFKVYKELKRQNEIIFEAEKERNAWELERDDLKGLARFTKKGELQSKIDRKNEEINILKIGLSGIAKRYAYQNVQDFTVFTTNPTMPIWLIGNKRLNGINSMKRTATSRIRKAYLNG